MEMFASLSGLFAVAFVAATILPAQSEAILVGMLSAGYPAALLIGVASLGNTLGAIVNWMLGPRRGALQAQTLVSCFRKRTRPSKAMV